MSITRIFRSEDAVPSWSTTSLDIVTDDSVGTGSLLAGAGLTLLAGLLNPQAEPEDGPIAVIGFGSADAVGENTLASVDVKAISVTRGLISFAAGAISAVASATAAAEGGAFAAAEASFAITGADLAVVGTRSLEGFDTTPEESWWSASKATSFFALDIKGIMPRTGSILAEFDAAGTLTEPIPTLMGNSAVFEGVVRAFGDSTLADLQVDVLAIADTFSSVNMVFTTASEGEPDPLRDPDVIRMGGLRTDRITTGSGDDWAFGLAGRDTLDLGAGDNTAFGGLGDDIIRGGSGHDWFFGGAGKDRLELGDGNNIGFGGLGADTILSGAGNDAIDAGLGADSVNAGNGDNTFRLGGIGTLGDGNDRYVAGSGADWYLLAGVFDNDTVTGFSIAQGDRLAGFAGDYASDAGLQTLNGTVISLFRPAGAPNDLVVTMTEAGEVSQLRLLGFFQLNAQYATIAPGGALDDATALPLMQALFVDADTDPGAAERLAFFAVADMLTPFG